MGPTCWKLLGYVQAVLRLRSPCVVPLETVLGCECRLSKQGAETCLVFDQSDVVLVATDRGSENAIGACASSRGLSVNLECIPSADSTLAANLDLESPSYRGDSKSSFTSRSCTGKRQRSGGNGSKFGSILHQLLALEHKNNAQVEGRVVRVVKCDSGVQFVVLLDVYLSATLWTRHNFWKSGAMVAASLSHLSCDWAYRRKVLDAVGLREEVFGYEDQNALEVGECYVLDCKLHFFLSDEGRRARFDLHSLFASLPSYEHEDKTPTTTIIRDDDGDGLPISRERGRCNLHSKPKTSGMWNLPDEIINSILSRLFPKDLHSAAAVCRHLRTLAVSVMPCMNLRLFPHQQSAVRWMLQRELDPKPVVHPYVRELQTEDGFLFYLDCVSGELSWVMPPSAIDFRGGLFCDEPGLGKTVTALSLILKTQGTLSEPPPGAKVRWCEHNCNQQYGYYEISTSALPLGGMFALKRCTTLKARRYHLDSPELLSLEGSGRKRARTSLPPLAPSPSHTPPFCHGLPHSAPAKLGATTASAEPIRASFRVKRKLCDAFGSFPVEPVRETRAASKALNDYRKLTNVTNDAKLAKGTAANSLSKLKSSKKQLVTGGDVEKQSLKSTLASEENEIWVQCDACSKWRKLPLEAEPPRDGLAWFCSMNRDVFHRDCAVPEEIFDTNERIKSLPGFVHIGGSREPGQDLNTSFFRNVLKEHSHLLDSESKRALSWVANLSHERLVKVSSAGFQLPPGLRLVSVSGEDEHQYDKLLTAFGLVKQKERKKGTRWWYPRGVENLIFDSPALKLALSDPVDDVTRLYLSKATLIVVPQNLIQHWKTQIRKHITSGQLRVYIWNDQKKPPLAHSLAWDYDIVITTFTRLSVEWSSRETSALVRIHWLRIMLDEGHTLGASLSLTNKLQMAISMQASRRWLLTGTPTPNTPSSQVAHLQPMLKFLHEEMYGKHQKAWEGAILRPFEAGSEEGRERLMSLLHRCMISARKADLHTIPPCIRKVKLLDFTEQHAASYNELVLTVKRNILMADWKDPSHVESLLNPKQWKFRSNTIRNVRLSCCVAGHIKFRNAGEDIKETMDIFVEQGMDPQSEEFVTIKSSLMLGGTCQRCREWCRLPIVTPCCHLLCLSCVSLDCEKCTLAECGSCYKMQSPADNARPENPNPKWPVPQDLIELQPSYVQHNWDPDWHATSSSKVAYLVEQLKILQAGSAKKLRLSSELNDGSSTSNSITGVTHASHAMQNTAPEKAIVFSQFLEHIHVVERQLASVGIQFVGMYSPMQPVSKMKSLMTFQQDRECSVLVMDGSAALGLDLSFVTHVYLMEPIWDRSMEEQVVSRAHRMGATRPVLVETLAMRGTIEEQMLNFLQDPVAFSRERHRDLQDVGDLNKQALRSMHDPAESSYLAQLEFVETQNNRQ